MNLSFRVQKKFKQKQTEQQQARRQTDIRMVGPSKNCLVSAKIRGKYKWRRGDTPDGTH